MADKNKTAEYAYQYLIKQGVPPTQAAGIIGNLQAESGFDTAVIGKADTKGSVGVAQWHSGRKDNLMSFAKQKGTHFTDLGTQLDFIVHELNQPGFKKAKNALYSAKTPDEAALAFMNEYERPAEWAKKQSSPLRINTARQISGLAPDPNFTYQPSGTQQASYTPEDTPIAPLYTDMPNMGGMATLPEEEDSEVVETESAGVTAANDLREQSFIKDYEESQPQVVAQQQGYEQIMPEAIDAVQYQPIEQPQYQQGGQIPVSSNGVYDYPGQEVIVPTSTGQITMQNVNYPILGTDEYGNQQMMQPGQEYQFPGKTVHEIPQFQMGGKIGFPVFTDPISAQVPKTTAPTPIPPKPVSLGIAAPSFMGAVNPTTGMVNTVVPTTLPAGSTEGEGTMLPQINIERDVVKDTVKKRGQEYKERSNDLDVAPEVIDPSKIKTQQEAVKLQQKLVDAGYNLDPEGKIGNRGIDGKIGKVTRRAIEDFNLSGEKGSYTSYKSGTGELGRCKEEQCSEYVQNEIFRNLKPNVDRDTWNAKVGLSGDAWKIGKNILAKGGKEVKNNKVSEGDVVTMYTGGSPYESEARKYGTDATHVGVVDKVNPDGSYYILHNVHIGDKESGFEGREKRDLVTNGFVHTSDTGGFPIRGAYRPNYGAVDTTGRTARVREDVRLNIDPKKAGKIKDLDKSLFGEDVGEKINNFIAPLNSIDNKRVLAQKHGLTETEYQSLAKAALGIMGQESGFGTSSKLLPKQIAANMLSSAELKQGETSRGASQLKYRTNYGNSDLTELGIDSGNFTEDKNVPLVTFDVVANHYKQLLKTGIPKEKALYKAVEKYNRGHNTKYSDANDSDYVNKVLRYADMFDTVDDKGTKYNTLVDKANLHENTIKKQKTLVGK